MAWIRPACVSFLVFVCLLGTGATLSAECVYIPLDVRQRHADLVFSGTITQTEQLPDGGKVTFEVDRVWKGHVGRTTVIYMQGVPEAPPYQRGHRYLIIAPKYALLDFRDERREALEQGSMPSGCGWNIPYEAVERDLPSLGRSHQPR